jgi:hypothetical protein
VEAAEVEKSADLVKALQAQGIPAVIFKKILA